MVRKFLQTSLSRLFRSCIYIICLCFQRLHAKWQRFSRSSFFFLSTFRLKIPVLLELVSSVLFTCYFFHNIFDLKKFTTPKRFLDFLDFPVTMFLALLETAFEMLENLKHNLSSSLPFFGCSGKAAVAFCYYFHIIVMPDMKTKKHRTEQANQVTINYVRRPLFVDIVIFQE